MALVVPADVRHWRPQHQTSAQGCQNQQCPPGQEQQEEGSSETREMETRTRERTILHPETFFFFFYGLFATSWCCLIAWGRRFINKCNWWMLQRRNCNQRKKENTAMGGEAYGLQSGIIRNVFCRPGRKIIATRCEEPMLRLKTGLFFRSI